MRPVRCLLSYHYHQRTNVAEFHRQLSVLDLEPDFFADSGAYSAWSVGQTIVPQQYVDWVLKWQNYFTVAAGPDVIGDAQSTCKATQAMQSQVTQIPVLPCFHVGEDWTWLRRYIGMSPYLALGGMVPFTRRKPVLHAWLQRAFNIIPRETKVHGFGLSTWSFLKRYPFHSVDSSTWRTPGRFKCIFLYDPVKHNVVQVDTSKREELLRFQRLFHYYGIRAQDSFRGTHNYAAAEAASIRSWWALEQGLGRSRIYLVITTARDFAKVVREIARDSATEGTDGRVSEAAAGSAQPARHAGGGDGQSGE
jgi:hypothetical protein